MSIFRDTASIVSLCIVSAGLLATVAILGYQWSVRLRTGAATLALMTLFVLPPGDGAGSPDPAVQPSSAGNIAGRPGIVHARDRLFADDEGPLLALGTTLFWGLWGYEHDRDRLGRNLAAVSYAGFDYIRVLAIVGPDGWRDRTVDPRESGWDGRVGALTDWAYDQYGLRVQWTIFGGVDSTPNPASRADAVGRFAATVAGRAHKVFGVEIANEGWQNGFSGASGQQEIKQLAAQLRETYDGPIATTAPRSIDCGAQRTWYSNSPASFVTLHFPREERQWDVIRDAWRDGQLACRGVPSAYSSNEPIGPYSSGREDRDPVRLAMAAALSWASGVGAYVLHTGPGIRGGGVEDRREGRPANIWETENWGAITAALDCVRFTLPSDLPSWTRREAGRDHPFETRVASGRGSPVRHHPAAVKGRRFVTLPVEIARPADLVARRAMTVRIVHPQSCATLVHRRLLRGDALRIEPEWQSVIVVGEWDGAQASP